VIALSVVPVLSGCGKPREDRSIEDLGPEEGKPRYIQEQKKKAQKQQDAASGKAGAPEKKTP
jgi:hypothetical protein